MNNPSMQTVTLASSLPEEPSLSGVLSPVASSQLSTPTPRGLNRARAWLGLTLSVGTIGVLGSQTEAVFAANSQVAQTSLQNLPTPTLVNPSSEKPDAQVEAPALKHEVKEGESLWALAENYQVDPEKLAQSNQLSPKAELSVGQTIKIPSFTAANGKVTQPTALPVTVEDLRNLETKASPEETVSLSQEHLTETRKRITESWTELKTEQPAATEGVKIAADVSDVSEPLTPSSPIPQPQITTLAPTESEATSIPVIGADGQEIAPSTAFSDTLPETEAIPITVPTPETHRAALPSSEPYPLPTETPLKPYKEPEVIDPYQNSSESEASWNTAPERPQTIDPYQNFPESEASWNTAPVRPQPLQQAYKPKTLIQTVPQPTIKTPVLNQTYQVQGGDTLNAIARRHEVSITALIQANNITNPNMIKANQTLIIPKAPDPKTAQESARLANLSFPDRKPSPYPVSVASPNLPIPVVEDRTEKLKQDLVNLQADYAPRNVEKTSQEITILANEETNTDSTIVGEVINPEWQKNQSSDHDSLNFESADTQVIGRGNAPETQTYTSFRIPVGETVSPELPSLTFPEDYLPDTPMKFTGYIWPAKGVLTSGWGRRWGRMHKGIDIAAPVGTPIVAAAEGEVISAGWNSGGYGNLVKLRHGDGSVTLYAHNSSILVRTGQTVEQGQMIAKMGSTGFSTGPHLHFEVHPSGQGARNPMAFLPKK